MILTKSKNLDTITSLKYGADLASTGVVLAYGCMSEVKVFRYTTFNQ